MDDHGSALTRAEAAALHDCPEPVAWFVLPAPYSNGVIARAHTETHHGGRLLPGYLAADDIEGLRAMLPEGLEFDLSPSHGSPPGCPWAGGGVPHGPARRGWTGPALTGNMGRRRRG